MPIHFRCNYCDSKLSITRKKGGLQVQCPSCYKYVRVPTLTEGNATPAQIKPEAVSVAEKKPLVKVKENALESMNPDMVLGSPTKDLPVPPAPPVYFDEFDDENPLYDVVQLSPADSQNAIGPITFRNLLKSKKVIIIIVMAFLVGFLAGFAVTYFLTRS